MIIIVNNQCVLKVFLLLLFFLLVSTHNLNTSTLNSPQKYKIMYLKSKPDTYLNILSIRLVSYSLYKA